MAHLFSPLLDLTQWDVICLTASAWSQLSLCVLFVSPCIGPTPQGLNRGSPGSSPAWFGILLAYDAPAWRLPPQASLSWPLIPVKNTLQPFVESCWSVFTPLSGTVSWNVMVNSKAKFLSEREPFESAGWLENQMPYYFPSLSRRFSGGSRVLVAFGSLIAWCTWAVAKELRARQQLHTEIDSLFFLTLCRSAQKRRLVDVVKGKIMPTFH